MHLRLDLKILSALAALMGGFLLLPAGLALLLDESPAPFVKTLVLGLALAALLYIPSRRAEGSLSTRDGFLVVSSGWALASLIACLPFIFAGALDPIDAWFEAVSGITTTGSTVITDIEALPHSLLTWRAFTQWIGGMGIILFTIAILPLLGVGGMQLFKAEVPGPVADKIAPRLVVTARYLWYVYVGLTLAEVALLRVGGMPLLECFDHAFTTLATGGFSPKNASIAAYASPWLRGVIIVFMFLAGMNFVLHFKLATGRAGAVVRDPEFRWYLALTAIFTIPTWIGLIAHGSSIGRALEDSLFTVVSLMTTTGYATADYELWPIGMHGPIILLLVLGGMAGSTGGGVKTLRTLIAMRALRCSFRRMLSPHGVHPVVYHGRPVASDVLAAIWGFFAAYFILAALGSLVVNAGGADLVTSWSASLTALGNVGPGMGAVGPTENFAWLSGYSKLVLSFLMLCGRLELYTVLLLFSPAFWRR